MNLQIRNINSITVSLAVGVGSCFHMNLQIGNINIYELITAESEVKVLSYELTNKEYQRDRENVLILNNGLVLSYELTNKEYQLHS